MCNPHGLLAESERSTEQGVHLAMEGLDPTEMANMTVIAKVLIKATITIVWNSA